MKDSTTYSPAQQFSLLLIGEPFSGKTTLACSFPNPGIIDADGKFANAYAYHKAKNPKFDFRLATIDSDDAGKTVPIEQRWTRFLDCCKEMCADTWVKTVIADSGTKIAQYLCDYILAQPVASLKGKELTVGGQRMMTQQEWYPFSILFQRMIAALNSTGKNIIMPVHIRTDKDEVTSTLIYRPSVPGQTGEAMGKLFTNYWLCQAKPQAPTVTNPRGTRYVVRTAPDARLSIGSAIPNLPPEFEFVWDDFRKLVPWLPQ